MNPIDAQPEDDSALDLAQAKEAAREWKLLWAREHERRCELEQQLNKQHED